MKQNIFELKPVQNSQTSFYKKAHVIETASRKFLQSYSTIVCYLDSKNNLHKLWNDYSPTTGKHIDDFLYQYTGHGINKRDWLDNYKTEKMPKGIKPINATYKTTYYQY